MKVLILLFMLTGCALDTSSMDSSMLKSNDIKIQKLEGYINRTSLLVKDLEGRISDLESVDYFTHKNLVEILLTIEKIKRDTENN